MGLNFGDLHRTAEGNHGDEEDDHSQNINGCIHGFGDDQDPHAAIPKDDTIIVNGSNFHVTGGLIHHGSSSNTSFIELWLAPVTQIK